MRNSCSASSKKLKVPSLALVERRTAARTSSALLLPSETLLHPSASTARCYPPLLSSTERRLNIMVPKRVGQEAWNAFTCSKHLPQQRHNLFEVQSTRLFS
jgi:hypothetical protein